MILFLSCLLPCWDGGKYTQSLSSIIQFLLSWTELKPCAGCFHCCEIIVCWIAPLYFLMTIPYVFSISIPIKLGIITPSPSPAFPSWEEITLSSLHTLSRPISSTCITHRFNTRGVLSFQRRWLLEYSWKGGTRCAKQIGSTYPLPRSEYSTKYSVDL